MWPTVALAAAGQQRGTILFDVSQTARAAAAVRSRVQCAMREVPFKAGRLMLDQLHRLPHAESLAATAAPVYEPLDRNLQIGILASPQAAYFFVSLCCFIRAAVDGGTIPLDRK